MRWFNILCLAGRPGLGQFVAGFAATNLGDVSPNTLGPHCMDTGLPCDNPHSTCNNRCDASFFHFSVARVHPTCARVFFADFLTVLAHVGL
jgi:hypothetical protein